MKWTGTKWMIAAWTMPRQEMPVIPAMMKAPAPMIGGMICPPEAAATLENRRFRA